MGHGAVLVVEGGLVVLVLDGEHGTASVVRVAVDSLASKGSKRRDEKGERKNEKREKR